MLQLKDDPPSLGSGGPWIKDLTVENLVIGSIINKFDDERPTPPKSAQRHGNPPPQTPQLQISWESHIQPSQSPQFLESPQSPKQVPQSIHEQMQEVAALSNIYHPQFGPPPGFQALPPAATQHPVIMESLDYKQEDDDDTEEPVREPAHPLQWAEWRSLLMRPSSPNLIRERDRYPSWEDGGPIDLMEIGDIFLRLRSTFGFQWSSMENIFDHFMIQLDSRASRMTKIEALRSLHASYIGGDNSNYKKWYFAAKIDIDDKVRFAKLGQKLKPDKKETTAPEGLAVPTESDSEEDDDFEKVEYHWTYQMKFRSPQEMVEDIALYLLIWGEANQVRFLPECICFLFECAKDYYAVEKAKIKENVPPHDAVVPAEVAEGREEGLEAQEENGLDVAPVPEARHMMNSYAFLDDVITPLYCFLRDQVYEAGPDGEMRKRDRDHKDIIGYDDVNQLFWYAEGIKRLYLKGTDEHLIDLSAGTRYSKLKDVDWNRAFYKTYKETRTWLHVATNFNRIWVIHFASYWFFTSFNSPTLYTKNYQQLLDNSPTQQVKFSVIALGGFLCCLIQLVATAAEWSFVPRKWSGRPNVLLRFIVLLIVTIVNLAPSVFIFGLFDLETHSHLAYVASVVQLVIAVITCIYFSFRPLLTLFSFGGFRQFRRRQSPVEVFTASFPGLTGRSYWFSILLWSTIFAFKFIESYFFLTLSIRDPIRVLSIMEMTRCVGDRYIGRFLCVHQAHLTLVLVYFCELILFFLDTYLWYIICNCFFSMALSFAMGISILTPWRNVFSRLPKRIHSKILATSEMEVKYKPKILVSQVWNAVIISMYREHLLPVEMVHKLLYHQAPSETDPTRKNSLKSPTFFISHDDSTFKSKEFFPLKSEAERRVSFFAQSLSTPIPEPTGVESMPTFTVLIPHYSEKILLSLQEIIREDNMNNRITLLEYLKRLYPTEWDCFVTDTKLMAQHHGRLRAQPVKYDTTRKVPSAHSDHSGLDSSSVENFQPEDGGQPQALGPDTPMSLGASKLGISYFHLKKVRSNLSDKRLNSNSTDDKNPKSLAEKFSEEVTRYNNERKTWIGSKTVWRNPPDTPHEVPCRPLEKNVEVVLDEKDESALPLSEDIPFFCVGFKDDLPEYHLRTRIWASLRSQTLYRTASGFANYTKALKLLYRIENPEMVSYYRENEYGLDKDLEAMAMRKFRLVIALQRLMEFSGQEKENYQFLLKAFPEVNVAYLERRIKRGTNDIVWYSCLVDGYCELDIYGDRIPKYRVRISGNPILGDGKSDNQNHLLIFYRGEYIQVIDANQDNYLEECIKIRSVLAEFEEMDVTRIDPYNAKEKKGPVESNSTSPVAIVGAREYIFSEKSGVLGDVAAGKEQTFGTLFARTLAEIGGKLHYGHPDFLNAIFMTTRGGISKAQRGLHLNEDIYAGMTAMLRGGRIKHCDYYQCGKGRDLGFASILNFTTKIGAGMGEQLLSREYYYLGTQLPLDRFLSFYYAHPGFHINNLFITLSVQIFMIVLMNLGALKHESIGCIYNKDVPYTDLQEPIGCYMIQPVLNWVTIFIFSVFLVFFIAFVPLIIQELTERGLWKALSRFFRHLLSLSPFFEVFVCQIYSNSLLSDVTFGGARYIGTGRGFSMGRGHFYSLYSKFTSSSIYSGAHLFLLLFFASLTIWQPALLWFWISLVSMCFAPFLFNPHQFSFEDFFVDYHDFIHWLSRGNSTTKTNAWINVVRQSRARYTGYQSKEPASKGAVNGDVQVRENIEVDGVNVADLLNDAEVGAANLENIDDINPTRPELLEDEDEDQGTNVRGLSRPGQQVPVSPEKYRGYRAPAEPRNMWRNVANREKEKKEKEKEKEKKRKKTPRGPKDQKKMEEKAKKEERKRKEEKKKHEKRERKVKDVQRQRHFNGLADRDLKFPVIRTPRFFDLCLAELVMPLIACVFLFFAYTFTNSQNGVRKVQPTNSVLRLIILVLGPIIVNAVVLALVFPITVVCGTIFCRLDFSPHAGYCAGLVHGISVMTHILLFEVIWFIEGWNFVRALLCLICVINIQEFIFTVVTVVFLTKEPRSNAMNRLWWTGLWFAKELRWKDVFVQPFREFICKVMETSQFAADFILGHGLLFVQTPLVLFPGVDSLHTLILFWLKPDKQFKRRFMLTVTKLNRRKTAIKYFLMYTAVLILFLAALIVPIFTLHYIPSIAEALEHTVFEGLIQPNNQWNDDTGANATSTIITTKGTMPHFKTHAW